MLNDQVVTLDLYHGTSHIMAQHIVAHGFRLRRLRYLSYGDGLYFYSVQDRAARYAVEQHRNGPSVVTVRVSVPPNRMRSFKTIFDLDRSAKYFNTLASESGLLVLDLSRDDGIFVVRPDGINLIDIRGVSSAMPPSAQQ